MTLHAPRRYPRTQAQELLLYTLAASGPTMEPHELLWKSGMRSERLFWSSLLKLNENLEIVRVPGTDAFRITDEGRRPRQIGRRR